MLYLRVLLLIGAILAFSGCSQENTHSRKELHTLNVAISEEPSSLDPRLIRDLPTTSIMRMMYEGLLRINEKGEIEAGAAATVILSEDQKTYTFNLRNCQWADGTPLTAEDFVESWKTILSPSFPAPNAYQLYVIKNGKQAKEGLISADGIGIKAVSPTTLTVELERPTPYFLEMTACHFYFPVHPQMRQQDVDRNLAIGNGPFKVNEWKKRNELRLEKNPNYWDADKVKIDGISLQILDENTALQLFKAGNLDWAGSPMSTIPQDAVDPLKQKSLLKVAAGAGTHWLRFNTEKSPFDNVKIRQAFNLAIDRQAIVKHVTQGNQRPAYGILPPLLGSGKQYFKDHDIENAQKLFKEAFAIKDDSPKIVLSYSANDRNHKIAQALQQQWNSAFNIDVALESTESHMLMEKMRKGFYQISLGSWFADINDPINFLEIFKSRENPTNQTFWQNSQFSELLDRSSMELDPHKRSKILAEAEETLMAGMPVSPLFHSAFNYLQKDNLFGIYFSPLGYLDFKNAYWIDGKQ
jgi:oligopeptide transport system substrate-binding protein